MYQSQANKTDSSVTTLGAHETFRGKLTNGISGTFFTDINGVCSIMAAEDRPPKANTASTFFAKTILTVDDDLLKRRLIILVHTATEDVQGTRKELGEQHWRSQ